ncbi:ATP-binding protein [Cylindrospermum sp. FACHB-282]|uniref:ATP-binding protein n=1 Tax=Cylindrospermum sp. FACHB-282 TaxID=2692794 RepID=UPI0016845B3C|nr:ATP-binding protein [Cylindrospermum sp. FACHB-282]MBD2385027.1 sensor histidine kinase [Cylindrospermum sp. FACHB-282]
MESADSEEQIKKLAKEIRILKKKLERSEDDRYQLEHASERSEAILKGVIRELEESQTTLKNRSRELEIALGNLKALQVKLIESEKRSALGVLVAGIAHEINNPISFIYGNLPYANNYFQDLFRLIQLYQQCYPEPVDIIKQEIEAIELEFIKEDLEKIFQSMHIGAERIAKIIKSLRTFSRFDEATLKVVDIHEEIDNTLVILNTRLRATPKNPNGIRLIREYEQIPLLTCYPSQLNQVFMNILSNAIDALEEANEQRTTEEIVAHHNTIWIYTRLIAENQIMISIADNGLGIPDTIKSRLFDPFFTTKTVGKGTGLGLSISYQIVTELHKGKLDFNSTIGQGTEFVLTLPIKANLI